MMFSKFFLQSHLAPILYLGILLLNGCGKGSIADGNCRPKDHIVCREGDTYWVDSCGTEGDQTSHCECGCNSDLTACEEPCDCSPSCTGKECGPDNCDGTCAPGCAAGETCNETTGQCEGCTADCAGKVCGPDGCGGTCTPGCTNGETCIEATGQCEGCTADCTGKVCGPDGCGGTCAPGCSADETCNDATGQCEGCTADCAGKVCGPDGCGGTCAPGCSADKTCNAIGQCVTLEASEFVTIPAGDFQMGSPESEAGRYEYEVQHPVTLNKGFVMQSTEVTQGQFEALMGYNPSENTTCGVNCPVEFVNWYEAAAYCNALSDAEKLPSCYDCTGSGTFANCEPAAAYATPYQCPGYRLPTEAEWEYAARAGTLTATYRGDLDAEHIYCESPNDVLDPIAWFCGNSGDTLHTVGTLAANDWDLHDMLGNVWEWVSDWYSDYPTTSISDPWGPADGSASGFKRVQRGGSYSRYALGSRAAIRNLFVPNGRRAGLGFRPVKSSQ